jgi:prepilin-type N-terminal cleavage/methylation domain-containing protein
MGARVAMMTSRVGTRANRSIKPRQLGAFTLIELIVVMALLSIVIAIGAPRLARFFHGQTVAEEGQRLLALTRYGQSRAASEGLPMILWMNPANGTYGLRIQDGFNAGGTTAPAGTGKDVSYKLGDGLRFQFEQGVTMPKQGASLLFAPDGSVEESSLHRVVIVQDDGDWSAIVESPNQLNYVTVQKTNARATMSW